MNLDKIIRECASSPQMNTAMLALAERGEVSKRVACLAGIAMNPKAREHFDNRLDAMWKPKRKPTRMSAKEVIIGGGLHAAIYSAVRVAKGFPPPLVLERSGRAGGAFAVSRGPSFFLNSRNRPGPLALPLQKGALNVLPGSELQPAHLSNAEYQRNSDLAFVVRAMLAANARVCTGVEAAEVRRRLKTQGNSEFRVPLVNGGVVYADRVIEATGLGKPLEIGPMESDGVRILNYAQFMTKMDESFPLRDLGRVAVIGGGDSAKTVIEALMGMGPQGDQLSMAALDRPKKIDWYGIGVGMKCDTWLGKSRSRYQPISRLLPSPGKIARVLPFAAAKRITGGFDSCYVDERPYDHVVVCVGFRKQNLIAADGYAEADGRIVGTRSGEQYRIGPAAGLELTAQENEATQAFALAPENLTAIFRYADRTAALAASLT